MGHRGLEPQTSSLPDCLVGTVNGAIADRRQAGVSVTDPVAPSITAPDGHACGDIGNSTMSASLSHNGGMGSATWFIGHGSGRWVAKSVRAGAGSQFRGEPDMTGVEVLGQGGGDPAARAGPAVGFPS
jgi:hypothetical protein